jgi:hypothetical protein
VPAALSQLALLLHATSAPNQQLKRLQDALQLQARASHSSGLLGPDQLAVFGAQYTLLQAWVQRQVCEEVGPAVDTLLGLLGV